MARSTIIPLRTALVAAFLLITQVLAASAVLGVDLGTEYIKAALVKPGIPLEIVLTKDSRRKESSAVAFKRAQNGATKGEFPERAYGSDAMALSARFPGDVFPNLKAILGLPVESKEVANYVTWHPALQVEKNKIRGTAAFKSKEGFTADEEAWMVEELLAMELQSIQKNAEALAGAGTTIKSVVITIPPFYTVEEKRAVELAAELAGLKVLSLISDGLAVGLNYATSRQFPSVSKGEKAEHHMVFDMGAGSTKATVLKMQSRDVKDVGKYNKTIQEVQVLGSGWDRTLGGDDLNAAIVQDMINKFVASSAAKAASVQATVVQTHGRAVAKLYKEAERLRHVLSANQNTQASFEGLFDDIDFKYKITRTEFEDMLEGRAARVAKAIEQALESSGLQAKDLESVILHGGATRTPFVQKELEKIFGKGDKLRSNVNADESAVFGAGFRAAELSPSFRVKEIRVAEGAVYPAGLKWTNDKGKVQHQRLWPATSHLGAAAKELTFGNKEDFSIDFYQQVPGLPSNDATPGVIEAPTKVFNTKNLTATIALMKEQYSCEPSVVSFKVSLRLAADNGEVEIVKAYVECEGEVVEKGSFVDGVKNMFGFGKKDQQPLKDGESADAEDSSESVDATSSATEKSTTTSGSATTGTASSSVSASPSAEPKKVKKIVSVPVTYETEKTGVAQLDKLDILQSKDRLRAFEGSDRARRAREEALNQLEGFTYKVRDLIESDVFIAASTKSERSSLEKKSSDASEWLYGDGADASKDELRKKLKTLQDIVIPVQSRIEESTKRPALIKGLQEALTKSEEFVKDIRGKIVEYEAFAALSSSSAAASSTSTVSESSTVTAAPSAKDDFAGLEDESSSTKKGSKERTQADALKELGPVRPLYTEEDLKEVEDLHTAMASWLKEKLTAQKKLGATDDPVLLVKDLTERRKTLDKAGTDLAMRAVRKFEQRTPKGKKAAADKEKAKSSKTKKGGSGKKTATFKEPEPGATFDASQFADFDAEDPESFSQERLEEMLKKIRSEQDAKTKKGGKAGKAGKSGKSSSSSAKGEERPRDEL